MKRVLHINDYPADQAGGAEVMMQRTMGLVGAADWDVDSFTARDLPDARVTCLRYVSNGIACRSLADKLDAFRPDVIHLHNFYHLLSPGILEVLAHKRREYGFRVVMTAHDYHLVCPNSGGHWFNRGVSHAFDPERITSLRYLLTRRWDERGWGHSALKVLQHLWNYRWRQAAAAIDVVVCPSRFSQRLLQTRFAHTVHLPHPSPAPRECYAERGDALRFVYVGRIEPEKGLANLLELWPRGLDATLTVIGSGQHEDRCARICDLRGLSDRVRFMGRLMHDHVLDEIAAAHVLIAPSLALESFGLTLLEALAVGTNVLASNRGAFTEIVEDSGVGYLFDPERPVTLYHQLQRIQEDHGAGRLVDFDVASYLHSHGESVYLSRLLDLYEGRETPKPRIAIAS